MKNWMAVGSYPQELILDHGQLYQILGDNRDVPGENSSNAAGKSMLLNALHYVLYGSIIKEIRKDKLVNHFNNKDMLVTLELEKDGIEYRIERGRKPNVLRMFVNGLEYNEDTGDTGDTGDDGTSDGGLSALGAAADVAQGENRFTQEKIIELIGLSSRMFLQIVGLNSHVSAFLDMKAADQRDFIEELLEISLLTEKAERLKVVRKETEAKLRDAEMQIQVGLESNRRVNEVITSLEAKGRLWESEQAARIQRARAELDALNQVRTSNEGAGNGSGEGEKDEEFDIEVEIANHKRIEEWHGLNEQVRTLEGEIAQGQLRIRAHRNRIERIESELVEIGNAKCHECGQGISMDVRVAKELERMAEIERIRGEIKAIEDENAEYKMGIEHLRTEMGPEPIRSEICRLASIEEAYNYNSRIERAEDKVKELESQITGEVANPFETEIAKHRAEGIVEIDRTERDELESMRDHQNYLIKLLSDKGSFIRKRIINQNLALLNKRLAVHLDALGLPHSVKFLPDLSVEIINFGKDLDWAQLSTGESTRLILALSWAFRDVHESLHGPINLMFIDERLDTGYDSFGITNCIPILEGFAENYGRSMFVITHKPELRDRLLNTITVVRENGMSTLRTETLDNE